MLDFFKDNDVNFEQVQKMLDDFRKSKRSQATIDGTDVSLIVVNTYNWKFLQPINCEPTPFFDNLFHKVIDETNVIRQTQESQGINYDAKLVFNLTDNYSTVEFSDGTTSFELTFFHANIVQLVINETPNGGISYANIRRILNIKSDEDIRNSLNFLVNKKILGVEGNIFKFIGPPDVSSSFTDESTEIHKRIVENVQFTNCNDQIEAAIYRFLKTKRFANTEDIKKFVFEQLRPQFNVTSEGVENCLKRLVEKEYITTHGSIEDSYKIRKI